MAVIVGHTDISWSRVIPAQRAETKSLDTKTTQHAKTIWVAVKPEKPPLDGYGKIIEHRITIVILFCQHLL